MNPPPKKIERLVWGGLLLIIVIIGTTYVWSRLQIPEGPLPVITQLADFHLTSQDNVAVSMADLRGKVWVADIIFTRCGGPCPAMTAQFAELQNQLPADQVRLVSLTRDPEFDSASVLKAYGKKFAADFNRWWFLTGSRDEIYQLAVKQIKFTIAEPDAEDRSSPPNLPHSTWFALVDRQGRVRGWMDKDGSQHATFESMEPEAMARLLPAVKQLLKEPAP